MDREDWLSADHKRVLEDELCAQIDAFVDDLSVLVKKEYEQLLDSIYIGLTDAEGEIKESNLPLS